MSLDSYKRHIAQSRSANMHCHFAVVAREPNHGAGLTVDRKAVFVLRPQFQLGCRPLSQKRFAVINNERKDRVGFLAIPFASETIELGGGWHPFGLGNVPRRVVTDPIEEDQLSILIESEVKLCRSDLKDPITDRAQRNICKLQLPVHYRRANWKVCFIVSPKTGIFLQ